jgi:hypothetical protein
MRTKILTIIELIINRLPFMRYVWIKKTAKILAEIMIIIALVSWFYFFFGFYLFYMKEYTRSLINTGAGSAGIVLSWYTNQAMKIIYRSSDKNKKQQQVK